MSTRKDLTPDQARVRAGKAFKEQERAREGKSAMAEYEAKARAIRENTARLRALRMARDLDVQQAGPQGTGKKRTSPKGRS